MDIGRLIISSIIILLWMIYSMMEGTREAYYYDSVVRSDRSYPNIHWIFFLERGVVLLIIGLLTLDIILPVGLALIFPWFHDGLYYMKRNDLEPRIYQKRFEASSTTSTAFFEMNYLVRSLVCIGGLIFLTVHYLLLIFR